jgi:hypothetical protein
VKGFLGQESSSSKVFGMIWWGLGFTKNLTASQKKFPPLSRVFRAICRIVDE